MKKVFSFLLSFAIYGLVWWFFFFLETVAERASLYDSDRILLWVVRPAVNFFIVWFSRIWITKAARLWPQKGFSVARACFVCGFAIGTIGELQLAPDWVLLCTCVLARFLALPLAIRHSSCLSDDRSGASPEASRLTAEAQVATAEAQEVSVVVSAVQNEVDSPKDKSNNSDGSFALLVFLFLGVLLTVAILISCGRPDGRSDSHQTAGPGIAAAARSAPKTILGYLPHESVTPTHSNIVSVISPIEPGMPFSYRMACCEEFCGIKFSTCDVGVGDSGIIAIEAVNTNCTESEFLLAARTMDAVIGTPLVSSDQRRRWYYKQGSLALSFNQTTKEQSRVVLSYRDFNCVLLSVRPQIAAPHSSSARP